MTSSPSQSPTSSPSVGDPATGYNGVIVGFVFALVGSLLLLWGSYAAYRRLSVSMRLREGVLNSELLPLFWVMASSGFFWMGATIFFWITGYAPHGGGTAGGWMLSNTAVPIFQGRPAGVPQVIYGLQVYTFVFFLWYAASVGVMYGVGALTMGVESVDEDVRRAFVDSGRSARKFGRRMADVLGYDSAGRNKRNSNKDGEFQQLTRDNTDDTIIN